MRQLLKESGFPGTKVLQFAFDGDPANPYLTENYKGPCVVYTGTHDNNTTVGWFRELDQDTRAKILQYLGYTVEEAWWFALESDAAILRGERLVDPTEKMDQGRIPAKPLNGRIPDPAIIATELLIDKAFCSSAKIAIIPLQDHLHLGSEARVNVPGTVVDNWSWRQSGPY